MEIKNINFDAVINKALESSLVKVDRKVFLCECFKGTEYDMELILERGPIAALCDRNFIAAKAKELSMKRVIGTSAVSFAAGLPGGSLLGVTIPADVLQYTAAMLKLSQELCYLYGAEDFWAEGNDVEDVKSRLIVNAGAMLDIDGGAELLRLTAANETPEGGIFEAAVKHITRDAGKELAKNAAMGGAAKVLPLIGGLVSGGVTYATLTPMGKRFAALMDEAVFDYGEVKMAADFKTVAEFALSAKAEPEKSFDAETVKENEVIDTDAVKAEIEGSIDEIKKGLRNLGETLGSTLGEVAAELKSKITVEYEDAEDAYYEPEFVPAEDTIDVYDALRKLGELHKDGILTDEEFAAKKAELLERI